MNEENMLNYPLSGFEMAFLNQNVPILKYTDLNSVFDLDDLFTNNDKIIILYLIHSDSYGHWTCLFKPPNGQYDYYFYDSYGYNVDDEFDNVPYTKRIKLNVEQDRLKMLLKNKKFDHNQYILQGKGTDTCGMHVSHRLNNYHMTEDEYIKNFLIRDIKNPDIYVAEWTLKNLKK